MGAMSREGNKRAWERGGERERENISPEGARPPTYYPRSKTRSIKEST